MAKLVLSEAEQAELPSLSPGQRAMRAARIATRTHGAQRTNDPTPTLDEAAAAYGTIRDMVSLARTILKNCSREEIAAVESGRLAVSVLAREIRSGSATRRTSYVEKGPHAARKEKMQENSRIWAQIRSAFETLSGLPRPEDVLPIIRGNDRGKAMQRKFPIALAWMNQLDKAWKGANHGRINGSVSEVEVGEAASGKAGESAAGDREDHAPASRSAA